MEEGEAGDAHERPGCGKNITDTLGMVSHPLFLLLAVPLFAPRLLHRDPVEHFGP
jgi:hypothetical protein